MIYQFTFLMAFFGLTLAHAHPGHPHGGGPTPSPVIGGFDMAKVEESLKTTGLDGMIHGAVNELGIYVLTIRHPGQVNGIEFPLITKDAAIQKKLTTLRRNDLVKVFGSFLQNHAPQRHIDVTRLDVVKAWNPGAEPTQVHPNVSFPQDLQGQTELIGKVHASADNGKVLVIDYKGAILPVFVEKPEVLPELWPNDKIRIKYIIRSYPTRPSHIELDANAKEPFKVLESMKAIKGTKATLKGTLVLFPKSVLTTMEVFAVETTDADGVRQYYFIFSGDMDVLEKAYTNLRRIWATDTKNRVTYRNRYLNRTIPIEVTGEIFVSNLAGNPQILIAAPDAVKKP